MLLRGGTLLGSRTLWWSGVLLRRRSSVLLGLWAWSWRATLLWRRRRMLLRSGSRPFRHRSLLRSGVLLLCRHRPLLRLRPLLLWSGALLLWLSPLLLRCSSLLHRLCPLLLRSGALLRDVTLLDCGNPTLFVHGSAALLLGCGSAALFVCRCAAFLEGRGTVLLIRLGIGMLSGHGGTYLVGVLLFLDDSRRWGGNRASGSDGANRGNLSRPTVVGCEKLLLILSSRLGHLTLLGERRCVGFVEGCELRGTRANVDAALSTVVADSVLDATVIGDIVVNHRVVIDVGDIAANVRHIAVVVEVVTAPVATEVADADVAKSVVNATVEADVGTPIAAMEAVAMVVITPVWRRPESAVVGGRAPGAGNPVVATVAIGPVTRRPNVVGIGSLGLIVLGERRRRLIGVVDRLLASVLVALILIVVALHDGGRLLLLLIALALLLRGVRGAGAEDLGVGSGGEIGLGRIGVGAGGRGTVVDGGGICRVVGAALAAGEADGQEGRCAEQADGAG